MFKDDNGTKIKIENIIIISILFFVIFVLGILLNGAKHYGFLAMETEKDVVITEKEIEAGEKEVLVAYADNIDVEVKPATPSEKISSRAAIARRDRGEDENYVSVDDVSISIDMDLSVRTGLSKEDFVDLISNCRADTTGFFEENAGIIYDLCQIYDINEIFFCGLISAESGWNIASNHRATHNYVSLMSNGGLIYFPSVEEGLEAAAIALHNNYLTPGGRFYRGSTLEGVRTIYCPVNPGWTSLVYGRMCQII